MSEEFGEEQPLVLRYEGDEGLPLLWVHLDVAGGTQIVPAILRADLPITVIAAQWADALACRGVPAFSRRSQPRGMMPQSSGVPAKGSPP